RSGASDRDGELRDRAGADRRGSRGAGSRRAGDLLAATPGAVRCPAGRAGASGHARARSGGAPLRRAGGRGLRSPLRRSRDERRREIRRSGAPRLPAAGGGRQAKPRIGCPRGAGAKRRREAQRAARGGVGVAARAVERTGLGRLLGLRRGGPEPPATRAGQPLRPLTLPNLVGFARLGMIVAFLAIALPSNDGRVALATVMWSIAAW